MPNLLIEIGNTAVKAAWSDGMTLGKTFRYQGEKWMEFIGSLLRKEKPSVLVVASACPLTGEEQAVLEKECGHLLLLDKDHRDLLLSHGLPSWLSYDRAASVLAARYLFRGMGCVIVDLGTTLTVDFTDPDGMYQGGNISLGCRTRFKALNRYARALPLVNTPVSCDLLGNSEITSMESGVISGIQFEMEGYLALHPDYIAVFTGGDANYFAKRMKSSIFVICNLVMMGLALMADEYVKKTDQ
jgi:type III pantothenate kinase